MRSPYRNEILNQSIPNQYTTDAVKGMVIHIAHCYSNLHSTQVSQFAEHLQGNIKSIEEQPIHETVLPEFNEPERTESSRRHLRQVSSLLWLIQQEGLVNDCTCYVELGAGKGMSSVTQLSDTVYKAEDIVCLYKLISGTGWIFKKCIPHSNEILFQIVVGYWKCHNCCQMMLNWTQTFVSIIKIS